MSRRSETRRVIKLIRADDRRLTTWMVDNFPVLIKEYGSARLDLRELTKVVRTLGLTNDHGGPLSEATISKTWARVRQQIAGGDKPPTAPKPTFPPGIVALASSSRTAAERSDPHGGVFRPSIAPRPVPAPVSPHEAPTLSSFSQSGPSQPAVRHQAPPRLSADEQIARFRRDQRAGTRPMPGTIEIPTK